MTTARKRTLMMSAAAAALGLLGLTLAVDVVQSRGVIGSVRHTSKPALPWKLAGHRPLPAKATEQPAGRAIAAYVDDNDEQWWLMLAGADRATYRRIDVRSLRGVGVPDALLSADGRFVAMKAGGGARRVSIVDLVDGSQRRVPELRLGVDDRVLAWSPDDDRLALQLAGKLAVVNVLSGKLTRYANGADAAAFSSTGEQIAASDAGNIVVIGRTSTTTLRVGAEYRIARAGWSADGTKIALQAKDDSALPALASLDLNTGTTTAARGSTAGVTAVAWHGTNEIVGATQSGLATYDLADGASQPLAIAPYGLVGFRGVQLATALVPEMLTVPTTRVDRGHPRTWYAVLAVVLIAMAIIGLSWPRPGTARRAGRKYANLGASREVALGVFGYAGVVLLIVLLPLVLLQRPELAGEFGSVIALGAAVLLAALVLRPRATLVQGHRVPARPKAGADA